MGAGKLLLYLAQRAAVVAAIWGGRKAWQLYQGEKPAKRPIPSSRARQYKILKAPAKEYKASNPAWLVRAVMQEPRSVEDDSIIAECPTYQGLLHKQQSGWSIGFGEEAKQLFVLDPKVTYLNHASYGAQLRVAGEVRQWCNAQLELEPVIFMENHAVQGVAAAVAEVAGLLEASWQDVVPVSNATEAINIVSSSLQLRRGDIIVVSNLTYPAIRNTFARLAAQKDANIMEVSLSIKAQQDPKLIVDTFREAIRGGYGRIRFALLDHVSSFPPVLWPVKELCQMFAKVGAKVMVDGAHCMGNLSHLDIPSLGCQYYTTNMHKWMCSGKNAAILWVHPKEQSATLPLVTSHGMNLGFRGEFLWQGTRDPTAWMSVPACTATYKALGLDNIISYNVELVKNAAQLLLGSWGTSILLGGPVASDATPSADVGNSNESVKGVGMIAVELPAMGPSLPPSIDSALALKFELEEDYKIEVPVAFWEKKLWVRISAQMYNTMKDYQKLADAVLKIRDAPPMVDSAL